MTRSPEACRTMAELRALIDTIDAELLTLLAERAACIDRAAVLKSAEGLPPRIEARVAEVVDNARAAAAARGLDPDAVEVLWRGMIEWSIAREERAMGLDGGGGA